MYDFYFGTKEEIEKNEKNFLLSVKRMMPRWVNSIPDSEFLAIHDDLNSLSTANEKPVIVETGVGASTIVLLYHVMKHDGKLYSWDFQSEKGAYIRQICTDTLSAVLDKNIFSCWNFIAYDSKSKYLGIPMLSELVDNVDFCFLDSEHTWDNLKGELDSVIPLLAENAIVAIDDANYDYKHTNTAYINMLRKKLGLASMPELDDNQSDVFYIATEKLLNEHWNSVDHIDDSYKKNYESDLFWSYYKADREVMAKEKMEKVAHLEHRYDSWRVSQKK